MNALNYQDTQIMFEESSSPKLLISGKETPVSIDPESKECYSDELPYCTFQSIQDLAQALVDNRLGQ